MWLHVTCLGILIDNLVILHCYCDKFLPSEASSISNARNRIWDNIKVPGLGWQILCKGNWNIQQTMQHLHTSTAIVDIWILRDVEPVCLRYSENSGSTVQLLYALIVLYAVSWRFFCSYIQASNPQNQMRGMRGRERENDFFVYKIWIIKQQQWRQTFFSVWQSAAVC